MSPFGNSVIDIFSTLALAGQILSVFLILILLTNFFSKKNKFSKKIVDLISQNYIVLIFVISAIAMLGSLTFSEVLNLLPCKLCWYQRIMMYPQVLISGIALVTNDFKVKKYLLGMSIVGICISIYHILVQTFPNTLQCNDEVAKCSAKEFATFGYITIPVMAFTAFLMIILVCVSVILAKRK